MDRPLKLHEVGWLLGQKENAVRYLCETGQLVGYRAGRSWRVESTTVRERLSGTLAHRRLRELLADQIAAPRTKKRSDRPYPLTMTKSECSPASAT